MEKIVIDPRIFITCRLCLEETGHFQITPGVQSQIKYCFDIEVDPFDTMPQLICRKCDTILGDYETIKRTFVGKQNALRARREVRKGLENQSTQQGVVSSSQENDNDCSEPPKRRNRRSDFSVGAKSSATEETPSRSVSPIARKKKKFSKRGAASRRELWEDNYTKSFVCRLCNKQFVNQGNVMRHVKAVHQNMVHQYKALFMNSCSVPMLKVDGKPNHINSLNVVLKPKKIIANKDNMAYHVIYTPLKINGMPDSDDDDESEPMKRKIELDSSDEEVIVKCPQNKRRRLLSKSSTDTVCLDGVNHDKVKSAIISDAEEDASAGDRSVDNKGEFIDVEGSSDSDQDSTMSSASSIIDLKSLKVSIGDYKTIQRIISTCQNKYMKKVGLEMEENSATNSDLNINNKILNIGRKVINKPGISCKGLLRYIENKNLELQWQPILEESLNNKESYVRILPKLKNKQNNTDKTGWKFSNSDEIKDTETETETEQAASYSDTANEEHRHSELNAGSNDIVFRVDDLLKEALQKEQAKVADINTDGARAVLYPVANNNESDKILLNANPVANPKQLPKKTACPRSAKPKKIIEDPNSTTVCDSLIISTTGELETELHMPIITSTTSLAVVDNEVHNKQVNGKAPPSEEMIIDSDVAHISKAPNDVEQNKSTIDASSATAATPMSVVVTADTSEIHTAAASVGPRIKVKPVSELMSKTALSSLGKQPVVASHNWNMVTPNHGMSLSNRLMSQPNQVMSQSNQVMSQSNQVMSQSNYAIAQSNHVISQSNQVMPPSSQVMSQSNQENRPSPMYLTCTQYQTPNAAKTSVNTEALTTSSNTNCGTSKQEYLILDTVQFPNTKTYSPFKYVQNLLQTYNIILLDDAGSLTPDFSSLVKFKVQFTHDAANRVPVVLSLSLYSYENQFYLGVREPNQPSFISVSSLSANWQWEVIKMYTSREGIDRKLLMKAEQISRKVYECANTFLCLVKSIRVGTP